MGQYGHGVKQQINKQINQQHNFDSHTFHKQHNCYSNTVALLKCIQ